MDKKQAQEYIQSVFQSAFSEETFTRFIRDLLNEFEPKENEYRGDSLWEAYREHIVQYRRIGKYIDPDGVELDVLVVEAQSISKLDRARTALRNFVVKHLETFQKDYALVAFYSREDGGADWRFSFVKIELDTVRTESGKRKVEKDLTPAKRYSYLVGEHENSYTAQKQLLPVLTNDYSNSTVEDLEQAFSIEKVTDEFFEQYKELYLKLSENKPLQQALDGELPDHNRFTKKLLGQIVFLYFLQKKGWLGVAKTDTWGKGDKRFMQTLFEQAIETEQNFFGDYLQYLFYEALAKDRRDSIDPAFYPRFNCKIPFLNGGLFEADYDWERLKLTIPNALFRNREKNKAGDTGTGILDVFDRYNFTIKEDEPLEKEVAVDPEMLGKVFENLLDVIDRKSKGAFYTPREIVHHMCQESLIHYLDNVLNDYGHTHQVLGSDQTDLFGNKHRKGQLALMAQEPQVLVPKDELETFIRRGFLAIENDRIVEAKGRETSAYRFKLPETIRLNAQTIDNHLRDIKICDPAIGSGAFPVGLLHEIVTARLVLNTFLQDSASHTSYKLKRHAIQESIYGVDIEASAVDIARLRLWLSLIVDEDDFYEIEALPNLDYKIVQGNSLIGLPHNIIRNPDTELILEELKIDFFNETNNEEKKEHRTQINQTIRQLLDSAEQYTGYPIDFDFKLYFSEVWHKKGGFDVVIGNPPYGLLNKKQNKHIGHSADEVFNEYFKKSLEFEAARGGVINVFRLFIVKSIGILSDKGVFCQIFPLSFTGDVTSKGLRKHIFENLNVIGLEIFPERDNENKRVFKHAKMSVCILTLSSHKGQKDSYIRVHRDKVVDETNEKINLSYSEIKLIDSSNLTIPIISKSDLVIMKKIYSTIRQRVRDIAHCYTGEIDLTLDRKYIKQSDSYSILLKGAILDRYLIRRRMSQGEIEYLDKDQYLLENKGKRANHFEQDRIVMQGITGVNEKIRLKMTIAKAGSFCANSVNYLFADTGVSNKFLLAQLNSSIHNYLFRLNSTNSNVNGYEVDNLPLVQENIYQNFFDNIVDYLIFLQEDIIDKNLLIKFYNNLLDSLVFELYFPTELKAARKEIARHIGELKPLTNKMSNEEKIAIISQEFSRMYDPAHPVRNALETLDSVDEVRIIWAAVR